MKKNIAVVPIVLLGVMLGACASQSPDTHTSRDSLDWAGVYTGTIPAASGPGINVTLTLISGNNSDFRYTLRYEYIGEPNGVFTADGTFAWNKAGNTITLDTAPKDFPAQYQVGENKLIQLDMRGKQITGDLADMYILTKQR
ncbi:copper resistance protein NlpE [Breznakiella homolactica]|uniref:Copper resistance protein NlpE N-terminal domain-containing protein n=1 Tax=Breznakiella homolactica TaxID=2798577 RepID=A0A7T8B8F6_9SPIR|nr:copper resistance protein NlpE [Breznakiella homolactica]QQO08539.1 copper resistance protein NlpE [Breznakiella homolactica]